MRPIVHLSGVSKGYGQGSQIELILSDVDLTLERGEKASLVGPSGSGKSTLIALIAGLRRPTSGDVEIDGIPMGDLDDAGRAGVRARRIGIALQSDNLIPFLSASENVEMAMAFAPGRTRDDARARARELLGRFGVGDRAEHRPRQLSGGEAQRVALAVALANEPEVLLADEVAAALDEDTAGRIVEDILAQDFAILYVTHDLAIADRAPIRYTIADGRLCPR
jgi:putative ABC transport system ATP-binding protein